ncbi:hypothetical protein C8J56DRAFT_1078090 [Mycena floridula]|nr:hypothetical protein C8J56DRAFT_1078090 [Mycena floridula]
MLQKRRFCRAHFASDQFSFDPPPSIPSPDEISYVHQTIQSWQMELRSVECRIQKLRAALDSLECQKGHLEQAIISHISIIHPVRKVPTEIFREIFRYSLEGNPWSSRLPLDPGPLC